jgi:hypothetical protein
MTARPREGLPAQGGHLNAPRDIVETSIKIMPDKKLIYRITALCAALLWSSASFADVIKLKNGRRLEGAIVNQTKDAVVIDIGAGEAYVSRADIASIERQEEDNAAIYYLRAIKFATCIEPGELKKKTDKIKTNKWKADEKDINDILKENTRCLEEIEKGLAIKKCDFEFERKYRYLARKEQKLDPKEVSALGRIFILKARSYELKKDFDKAIDWYLSAITFASQISQSDDPELKRSAINLESQVYPLIKDCLDSVDVGKANCARIIDKLSSYEKERFLLKDYVKSGKEWYLDFFQSFESDVTRWYREHYQVDIKIRKKALRYAQGLSKQASEQADKYYGAFLKAAESDLDADWKAANDEYDNLIKGNNPQSLEDDIDRAVFIRDNFGKYEEFEKRDQKTVSIMWLIYDLSGTKDGIDGYRQTAKDNKELRALAKLKSVTTYK